MSPNQQEVTSSNYFLYFLTDAFISKATTLTILCPHTLSKVPIYSHFFVLANMQKNFGCCLRVCNTFFFFYIV